MSNLFDSIRATKGDGKQKRKPAGHTKAQKQGNITGRPANLKPMTWGRSTHIMPGFLWIK